MQMQKTRIKSEVESRADFSYIRYSQCWEDTEVVLNALEIKPGDRCLSIASAGDNSLSLLAKAPEQVVALDLNPTQLALSALKIAGIKNLRREDLMTLLGFLPARPEKRLALYEVLEPELPPSAHEFFRNNITLVEDGLAMFPDAVTTRGQKHLEELVGLKKAGHRAVIFYLIQRMDAACFTPAAAIDPAYAEKLIRAADCGVEIITRDVVIAPESVPGRISLRNTIPVELDPDKIKALKIKRPC